MLNMKVLDFRIVSDSDNITVTKARRDENNQIIIKTDKEGNQTESVALIGYYQTLEKACIAIERDCVLASDKEIKTVREYKETLESIHTRLKNDLDFGEDW